MDHHGLHLQFLVLTVVRSVGRRPEENRDPISQFLRLLPMTRLGFLAEYLVKPPLSLGTVRELEY